MGGGQRRQTQTAGLQAGAQCTAAGGGIYTHTLSYVVNCTSFILVLHRKIFANSIFFLYFSWISLIRDRGITVKNCLLILFNYCIIMAVYTLVCPSLHAEVSWCNTASVCQQTRLTRSPVERGNTRGEISTLNTIFYHITIHLSISGKWLCVSPAGAGPGWDQESSLVYHQLQCSNRREFINWSGLAIRWYCCKDLHHWLNVSPSTATSYLVSSDVITSSSLDYGDLKDQNAAQCFCSISCCNMQTSV